MKKEVINVKFLPIHLSMVSFATNTCVKFVLHMVQLEELKYAQDAGTPMIEAYVRSWFLLSYVYNHLGFSIYQDIARGCPG